jgi:hypothetical protein
LVLCQILFDDWSDDQGKASQIEVYNENRSRSFSGDFFYNKLF